MPSKVKFELPHFSLAETFSCSLLNFLLPIQTIFVLSEFTFNNDNKPKPSKIFRAACKELVFPSSKIVVSLQTVLVYKSKIQ